MPKPRKVPISLPDDASVAEAARQLLRSRVKGLAYYAWRVKNTKGKVAEEIHNLRVWSRRLTAALRLFDAWLSRKRRRRLKRIATRLRRTAGRVRDHDVLLHNLSSQGTNSSTVRLARLLRKRRRGLNDRLLVVLDKHLRGKKPRHRLKTSLARISKKTSITKGRPESHFGSWGAIELHTIAGEFFRAGSADLSDDLNFHQLRIAGKRLRYATELVAASHPGLADTDAFHQLVLLQDRLGKTCDHLAGVRRLSQLLDAAPAADQTLIQQAITQERKRFQLEKRRFLRWWTVVRQRSFRKTWQRSLEGS